MRLLSIKQQKKMDKFVRSCEVKAARPRSIFQLSFTVFQESIFEYQKSNENQLFIDRTNTSLFQSPSLKQRY